MKEINDFTHEQTMTVSELRAALDEHDGAMAVMSEGCDCMGSIGRVVMYNGMVELRRHEERGNY